MLCKVGVIAGAFVEHGRAACGLSSVCGGRLGSAERVASWVDAFQMARVALRDCDERGVAGAAARGGGGVVDFVARLPHADGGAGHVREGNWQERLGGGCRGCTVKEEEEEEEGERGE